MAISTGQGWLVTAQEPARPPGSPRVVAAHFGAPTDREQAFLGERDPAETLLSLQGLSQRQRRHHEPASPLTSAVQEEEEGPQG